MSDRYRTPHHRPEAAPRRRALAKASGRAARVLFVGADEAEALADLRATDDELDVTVCSEADLSSGRETAEHDPFDADPFDAAVWVPSDVELEALPATDEGMGPESFRPLLAKKGRLLVEVPSADRLRAEEALSEAGFLIRRAVRLLPAQESDAGSDDERTTRRLIVTQRDAYRIRPCEAEDEAEILRLFVPLFHVARTAEHWRWKYLENPWGRRWISLAVAADGELAAHYAGYPVPFVRHPRGRGSERDEMLGVQIGDTMTAPGHRRVGLGDANLLGRAIRHHIARFSRDRAAFYYGFNTGNIRKYNLRFIQVRWAGTVGYWVRDGSLPALPRHRRFVGGAKGIGASDGRLADALDGRLGGELDAFFDRVSPHYGVLVRRDARWLRWRYAQCPDDPPFVLFVLRRFGRVGPVVGWGVFRRHVRDGVPELRWVDALFDPRHAHRAGEVLRTALEHESSQRESLQQRGTNTVDIGTEAIRRVTAWFSPRPEWWLRELDRLGFERRPEPDDLGLIYRPFERPDADDFLHQLYYTRGDSDLA